MPSQSEKAEQFLKLHTTLLLPNAWDVVSARLFEAAGFPAVATTSAGVAFANGYQDGERISRDEMLRVTAQITAAVRVPVTADIEAGYGTLPADVAATIQGVIEAGAVGVNLEDALGSDLYPLDKQVERIKAARETANQAGIVLVINARTDTYLMQIGAESTRLENTLRRAHAYYQAGANSIFVPGVVDPELIEILVREIPAPLNIMAGPGAPSAPELFSLGVKRVSIGASAMLATMGLIRDIARELHDHGTYGALAGHPYSFGEAWKLFGQSGA